MLTTVLKVVKVLASGKKSKLETKNNEKKATCTNHRAITLQEFFHATISDSRYEKQRFS